MGFDPSIQIMDDIVSVIIVNVRPKVKTCFYNIYFYGAWVTAKKENVMIYILKDIFPLAKKIEVYSDIVGGTRSVYGHNARIACILGTGANSCLYNGEKIIDQVYAGGYIIGDEGSGAVLGRNLLNAFLKRELSLDVYDKLIKHFNLSYAYIVEKVYKTQFANRWMAGFAKFLNENQKDPSIYKILVDSFNIFFEKNIEKYKYYKSYPVNFIGSVAYFFKPILSEIAIQRGITIGKTTISPSNGLIEYHKLEWNR